MPNDIDLPPLIRRLSKAQAVIIDGEYLDASIERLTYGLHNSTHIAEESRVGVISEKFSDLQDKYEATLLELEEIRQNHIALKKELSAAHQRIARFDQEREIEREQEAQLRQEAADALDAAIGELKSFTGEQG